MPSRRRIPPCRLSRKPSARSSPDVAGMQARMLQRCWAGCCRDATVVRRMCLPWSGARNVTAVWRVSSGGERGPRRQPVIWPVPGRGGPVRVGMGGSVGGSCVVLPGEVCRRMMADTQFVRCGVDAAVIVKRIRALSGITRPELAALAGVSASTIARVVWRVASMREASGMPCPG